MPKQKWGSTKQYCAEPEADPFESFYRKFGDDFCDYMNEVPCKLPKVEEHYADPSELLETISSIDLPAHRLTGKVRLQYLNFLEKLLERNYATWSSTMESYDSVTFTPDEVKRCAASIEMKAVQSCMIVSLYRNYVLKLISQIRKETSEATLHPNLINMKYTPKTIKKECCSISVQTDPIEQFQTTSDQDLHRPAVPVPAEVSVPICSIDLPPILDVPAMSLDEKIRNFERTMQMAKTVQSPPVDEIKSRKSSSRHDKSKRSGRSRSRNTGRSSSRQDKVMDTVEGEPSRELVNVVPQVQPVATPVAPMTMVIPKPPDQDDEIIRELEAMFDTGDSGNIFESCENQVQINAIINEIEKFHPTATSESFDTKNTQPIPAPQEAVRVPSPVFEYTISSSHDHSSSPAIAATSEQPNGHTDETDLRKSLWPCEFHMQKMKLRELLSNIAEANYLKYERIRARFVVLFGEYEDDEDELGPYSPSIELNEVLVSSCRQRIAKWVVQALMKPLNDGLIGNRFLFKKLAKHVADSIIYLNQYPDQRFIKNYIVDYFCTHPMIASVEDMY